MIQINATPGPQLRAQLVGLGYGSVIPALRNVGPIPPVLQKAIQDAAAGPSTGSGSGTDLLPPASPPPTTPPADTNWLLWGGVGVGVLFLGLLIIRR